MRKNEQTRVCTARTTTRQATLFSSRHSAEHLRALEPFFHFVAGGVWTGTFPCNWDDGACTLDISLHFRFPLWSKSPVWRSFVFCRVSAFFFVLFHWCGPRLSQDDQAYLNTTLSVLNEAQLRVVAKSCMSILFHVHCANGRNLVMRKSIHIDWRRESCFVSCCMIYSMRCTMHHAPAYKVIYWRHRQNPWTELVVKSQPFPVLLGGCHWPVVVYTRRQFMNISCNWHALIVIANDRQEHLLTRMEHGSWLDLKSEICVFQMKCKNRHKFHEFRWNWPPWPAVGHGGRSWKCEEFGQSIWTNCNVCNWLYDCISSYIISIHISYIIIYILYILYT